MQQYLINTSIIWLACLLVYEILLRKESFHQYNRMYLLGSLLLGLLLPFVNLNNLYTFSKTTLPKPSAQIVELKKVIHFENNSMPIENASFQLSTILWLIYFAGILIGIILITREIISLIQLYKNGIKSNELNCTIIETGKNHAPFSFLDKIFVRSKQEYSNAEWNLLITHEKEHSKQLHCIDNICLILLRLVFWFNPLPHIYFKRLRMLHEFQADEISSNNKAEYGAFLIEQNLLQGAPILTHSFNYSPIKNRITMLTKKRSSSKKLIKYLSVIPLLLLLLIFCTQTSISEVIHKNKSQVLFKGNKITFGELKIIPYAYKEIIAQQKKAFLQASLPDSVLLNDWQTNKLVMTAIEKDIMPITLNGEPIFGKEEQYFMPDADKKFSEPVIVGTEKNVEAYLFANLKSTLNNLDDGFYVFHLDRLVIDQDGNIAYYEKPGLDIYMGESEKRPTISADVKQLIEQKLIELLDGNLKFKPAIKDGKPIHARMPTDKYQIIIKNHKAELAARGGC